MKTDTNASRLAEGTLAGTPLPQLLAYIRERSLTGTLTLSEGGPSRSFSFDGGALTAIGGDAGDTGRPTDAIQFSPSAAFHFDPVPAGVDGVANGAVTTTEELMWAAVRGATLTVAIMARLRSLHGRAARLRDEAVLPVFTDAVSQSHLAALRGGCAVDRLVQDDTGVRVLYFLLLVRSLEVTTLSGRPLSREIPAVKGPTEQDRMHADFVERATAMLGMDHFALLGVGRDCDNSEVEAAYVAAAKRWHPDRLSPELAGVRQYAAQVFSRLTFARDVLVDEAQRRDYVRKSLGEGGDDETRNAAAAVEASVKFQKAEFYLRRNQLGEAMRFCRESLELDPDQADYVALEAWLSSMMAPDSAEVREKAIAQLTKAIERNAQNERAYYYRGVLRQRHGLPEAAISDFKKVTELNPRHIDAQREIRLFRMRNPATRSSGPPAKPAGLMGKLFGKR